MHTLSSCFAHLFHLLYMYILKQDQTATRTRPSDLILEVTRGDGVGADACATPRIVEFLNLEDNTAAITSAVRLDEPLFQPYPSKVVFEGYEAFGRQQKVRLLKRGGCRRAKTKSDIWLRYFPVEKGKTIIFKNVFSGTTNLECSLESQPPRPPPRRRAKIYKSPFEVPYNLDMSVQAFGFL